MTYRALVLPPSPPATSETVRRLLSRSGRRDTAPELALRRALHALGLRFLVDVPAPGTSRRRRVDVLLRGARIAVLVHGCFWHGCAEHFHAPQANAEWWRLKLASVRRRDADTLEQLVAAGWLPVVVWEHEDMVERAQQLAVLAAERRAALHAARRAATGGARRGASPRGASGRAGTGAARQAATSAARQAATSAVRRGAAPRAATAGRPDVTGAPRRAATGAARQAATSAAPRGGAAPEHGRGPHEPACRGGAAAPRSPP